MKKILLTFFMSMLLFTLTSKAQDSWAFSVQGGYSWINGVVGADLQYEHVGFGIGWMPTTMPLSGTKLDSYCLSATYYSELHYETGWYGSIGVTSKGYRYENSWGYDESEPMTIAMIGIKGGSYGFFWKVGIGYGWAESANSLTGEILIGIPLVFE